MATSLAFFIIGFLSSLNAADLFPNSKQAMIWHALASPIPSCFFKLVILILDKDLRLYLLNNLFDFSFYFFRVEQYINRIVVGNRV